MTENKLDLPSICAREVPDPRTTAPHILPLYATSSYVFESIDQGIQIFDGQEPGHVYSRYGNPTCEAVAQKICDLETYRLPVDGFGLLCSSGMSAIATLVQGTLSAGDTILTQGNLYGGTTELFTKIFGRFGIKTTMVDLGDLTKVEAALSADPSIRMIYAETPANPSMACVDLGQLAAFAKAHDCLSVVDNTFLTPYLQRPLEFGIDFVIHSTTKFLNGHGNSIAGAIVGADAAQWRQPIWTALKLNGSNASPWEAWLTHQGMKTLALRMTQHSVNALAFAKWLEEQPQVERVNYPGLKSHPDHDVARRQCSQYGAMLSFELKGGLEAGITCMNHLKMATLAPTLGDVDTLVLHPASMSHKNIDREIRERNGITDGLIRVNVGIESIEDIVHDFAQAIEQI